MRSPGWPCTPPAAPTRRVYLRRQKREFFIYLVPRVPLRPVAKVGAASGGPPILKTVIEAFEGMGMIFFGGDSIMCGAAGGGTSESAIFGEDFGFFSGEKMGHGVEGLLPIGLKWRFSKGKLDLDEEITPGRPRPADRNNKKKSASRRKGVEKKRDVKRPKGKNSSGGEEFIEGIKIELKEGATPSLDLFAHRKKIEVGRFCDDDKFLEIARGSTPRALPEARTHPDHSGSCGTVSAVYPFYNYPESVNP
ncbi:hypothetical protein GEV33_009293 [Tenebrio molitor]|uniref:Uncharacterized protein n=1 Tax=Tenebrio molitor TaxID=7067 RepID=A0A8J6HG09_TENMO|nr:hypothetical protein GEV33_009293 [Tenebrio molitor]